MADISNQVIIAPEAMEMWRSVRTGAIRQLKATGVEIDSGFAEVHEIWDGGLLISARLTDTVSVAMTVAPSEWSWNEQQN